MSFVSGRRAIWDDVYWRGLYSAQVSANMGRRNKMPTRDVKTDVATMHWHWLLGATFYEHWMLHQGKYSIVKVHTDADFIVLPTRVPTQECEGDTDTG